MLVPALLLNGTAADAPDLGLSRSSESPIVLQCNCRLLQRVLLARAAATYARVNPHRTVVRTFSKHQPRGATHTNPKWPTRCRLRSATSPGTRAQACHVDAGFGTVLAAGSGVKPTGLSHNRQCRGDVCGPVPSLSGGRASKRTNSLRSPKSIPQTRRRRLSRPSTGPDASQRAHPLERPHARSPEQTLGRCVESTGTPREGTLPWCKRLILRRMRQLR